MSFSLNKSTSYLSLCSTELFLLAVLGFHCGAQARLVAACRLSCPAAYGISVPQPGIQPTSPALEGRFLTTRLPGKSLSLNSFSNETSRTCASLSPENRCVISIKRLWVQVLIRILTGFESQLMGSSLKSELHGFTRAQASVLYYPPITLMCSTP